MHLCKDTANYLNPYCAFRSIANVVTKSRHTRLVMVAC